MTYKITFKAHAIRAFRKLPRDVQELLKPVVDGLRSQPRPIGAKKLRGAEITYRIRMGDYRLIYEVHDK